MKHLYLPAGIGILLAIGFVAGRISSTQGNNTAVGEKRNELGKNRHTSVRGQDERPSDRTRSGKLRQAIRSARSDEIKALAKQAISTGDSVVRMALFNEILGRMDAENFLQLTAVPGELSAETGRDNRSEWFMLHVRAGQVAGEEAMEAIGAQNGWRSEKIGSVMRGWAMTDPATALVWLESQKNMAAADRASLVTFLTAGAVFHDEAGAKTLLAGLTESERTQCVPGFVPALIQQSGKEGALAWLQEVKSSAPKSPFETAATQKVFDHFLTNGANQWDAAAMVKEMEALSKVIPLHDDWFSRGMGRVLYNSPTGGINYLNEIAKNPTLSEIPMSDWMYDNAVRRCLSQDRSALDAWIAKHPDSPAMEKFAAAQERVSRTMGITR
ncbi:MAG: hypothetical protein V4733_11180 [Verrucomicrobiota bacterium]